MWRTTLSERSFVLGALLVVLALFVKEGLLLFDPVMYFCFLVNLTQLVVLNLPVSIVVRDVIIMRCA